MSRQRHAVSGVFADIVQVFNLEMAAFSRREKEMQQTTQTRPSSATATTNSSAAAVAMTTAPVAAAAVTMTTTVSAGVDLAVCTTVNEASSQLQPSAPGLMLFTFFCQTLIMDVYTAPISGQLS